MNSALDLLLSRALSLDSCGRKHSTTIYTLTPEIKQIETEKERQLKRVGDGQAPLNVIS